METLYWINCVKIEENLSLSIEKNKIITFILCEHTDNKEAIKKIALILEQAGCHETYFYGRQENIWHLIFDEVDIKSNFEFDTMTTGYKNKDDFIFSLEMATRCNNKDRVIYLFYDDEQLFHSVIHELIGRDRPCPLMDGEDINTDECFKINMIAHRFIKPTCLPEKAKTKTKRASIQSELKKRIFPLFLISFRPSAPQVNCIFD